MNITFSILPIFKNDLRRNNIKRKITVDAKEGDIVIFPSFINHRAPKMQSDTRKTIISFNLQFELIQDNIFKIIDNL